MAIDLKQLLSPEKFVPFYAERKYLPPESMSPIAVELHWTSDCNYDCIHCSYGSRRQSKGKLTDEQAQSVVDDLIAMKAAAVYLSGGGEPTVFKGWQDYAEQLISGGVEVALITNGVVPSASQANVLSRMNYVAVSVYSTDEVEYAKITESRFFDRQWSTPGIIKASQGRAIVGARCVLNQINHRNLLRIYHKARESSYEYIIFIPAVDYEGRGVSLNLDQQQQVLQLIDSNINAFDPQFTNALDLLPRKVNHYHPFDYRKGFKNASVGCSAIKIRGNAFVNYCGGIWLCQPHIGNERYCIGNLDKNRFSEIWNSSRHHEVVNSLNEDFKTGRCANCRSIAFNRAADQFDHGAIGLNPSTPIDPFI